MIHREHELKNIYCKWYKQAQMGSAIPVSSEMSQLRPENEDVLSIGWKMIRNKTNSNFKCL